jgi:hypothetical protein
MNAGLATTAYVIDGHSTDNAIDIAREARTNRTAEVARKMTNNQCLKTCVKKEGSSSGT